MNLDRRHFVKCFGLIPVLGPFLVMNEGEKESDVPDWLKNSYKVSHEFGFRGVSQEDHEAKLAEFRAAAIYERAIHQLQPHYPVLNSVEYCLQLEKFILVPNTGDEAADQITTQNAIVMFLWTPWAYYLETYSAHDEWKRKNI